MKKIFPIIVFAVSCLLYVYGYFLRTTPSTMTHQLISHFNVSAGGLGLLSAMYFYGYTPMQIPAGILYDFFGPRLLMSIAILLSAVATLMFSMTDSLWVAGFCRWLMGFSAAFGFVGALLIAARWFPPKMYAMLAGLVQTLGAVGAIVGLAPVAELNQKFGWQHTLFFAAIAGVICFVLNVLFIRDYPKNQGKQVKTTNNRQKPSKHDMRAFFYNPQTWWVGLYSFCCWAPVSVFAALWGVPFLESVFHQTATIASAGISLVWVGIAIGSPLAGWWSNKIKRRKVPLVTCAIIATIGSLLVIFANHLAPIWVDVSLFLFGLGASSQVVTFGVVKDINKEEVLGSATGLNNMFVMLGGLAVQPLVGVLLTKFWNKQMLHGIPFYGAHDFHMALLIIPIVGFISILIASVFIKETHCSNA